MPINVGEGLSQVEARKKLKEFGPNEIKDSSQSSLLTVLLRQIKNNFIVYLLLLGGIIAFFVGETITGFTIFIVLLVIIVIGFIQEYRAEQAIKALREMITHVSIVIREGKEQEVPSSELVPGDVVVLRLGERVPADCLVLEESELSLNESILTGESREVGKKAVTDLNHYDNDNVVFMGSYVINGTCKACIVHTGMNTRFGSIASMISQTEKSLPLQDKVNKITKYMVYATITISLLTGIFMLARLDTFSIQTISPILILMIALSVSAFPEGLPVVLITTLAVGATRMARQNAIVNRMSTIETLGETTVICADKTGTITTGEMTVKKIFVDSEVIDVSGVGYKANGAFLLDGKTVVVKDNRMLQLLLKSAILCNDAKIERTEEDEEYKILGTPTEGALLILAAKAHLFQGDTKATRIEEIPFNSKRKIMSVLCQEDSKKYIYVKGALEVLLNNCTHIQQGDKVVPLTSTEKEKIIALNGQLANSSYRTIAFSYKQATAGGNTYEEDNLIFLGLVGIDDPPREEVAASIQVCKQAGIAVKMITGDNRETAVAIAHSIGLDGDVLEGSALDQMTDDELSKCINEVVVFARVSPEHKIRIVNVLKNNGEVVTMTGDGVNDAPALKEAHVGVAMGKNGTDLSRSVADLTLRDDNFATIVLAIKEGRTIFINIRKFVSFQLSCNWSELLIIFIGVLLVPVLGWDVPVLLALQILFVNLVTDDLPAITLGLNRSSKDVMREKPQRKLEILNKKTLLFMCFATILISSFTLISFYISYNVFHESTLVARTIALASLIMLEISSAFAFRSFRFPVLTRSPLVNKYLFGASIGSIFALMIILYTSLQTIFEVFPLHLKQWGLVLIFPILYLVLFDIFKLIIGRMRA